MALIPETFKLIPLLNGKKEPRKSAHGWNKPEADLISLTNEAKTYQNRGIPTAMNGLIVVDFDLYTKPRKGKVRQSPEYIDLPWIKNTFGEDACVVKSWNDGYHVYLLSDERTTSWNDRGVGGYIDLLHKQGTYAVAPGSRIIDVPKDSDENDEIYDGTYEIVNGCLSNVTAMSHTAYEFLNPLVTTHRNAKKHKSATTGQIDRDDLNDKIIPALEKYDFAWGKFTNVQFPWANNPNVFTCDQQDLARGICPLCGRGHTKQNYSVFYTSNGTYYVDIVKNGSCIRTAFLWDGDYDEDETKLLKMGFSDDYILMKRKISISWIDSSLEFMVQQGDVIRRYNKKDLKKLFFDKWYWIDKTRRHFITDYLLDPFKQMYDT